MTHSRRLVLLAALLIAALVVVGFLYTNAQQHQSAAPGPTATAAQTAPGDDEDSTEGEDAAGGPTPTVAATPGRPSARRRPVREDRPLPHSPSTLTSRAVGVTVQYSTGTFSLADGSAFVVHQVIFALAQLCLIAGALGFARRSSLAGRTRTGRICLRIFSGCWAVIVIAGVLVNFLGIEGAALGRGVGGILFTLSALGAGIAVAAAPVLGGWARWSLLAFGAYGLLDVVDALLIGDLSRGPTYSVELVWALLLGLVGVSVLASVRGPRTAGRLA